MFHQSKDLWYPYNTTDYEGEAQYTSYGFNGVMRDEPGGEAFLFSSWSKPKRLITVKSPVESVMFQDAWEDVMDRNNHEDYAVRTGEHSEAFFRHMNKCPTTFIDGHAVPVSKFNLEDENYYYVPE